MPSLTFTRRRLAPSSSAFPRSRVSHAVVVLVSSHLCSSILSVDEKVKGTAKSELARSVEEHGRASVGPERGGGVDLLVPPLASPAPAPARPPSPLRNVVLLPEHERSGLFPTTNPTAASCRASREAASWRPGGLTHGLRCQASLSGQEGLVGVRARRRPPFHGLLSIMWR